MRINLSGCFSAHRRSPKPQNWCSATNTNGDGGGYHFRHAAGLASRVVAVVLNEAVDLLLRHARTTQRSGECLRRHVDETHWSSDGISIDTIVQ